MKKQDQNTLPGKQSTTVTYRKRPNNKLLNAVAAIANVGNRKREGGVWHDPAKEKDAVKGTAAQAATEDPAQAVAGVPDVSEEVPTVDNLPDTDDIPEAEDFVSQGNVVAQDDLYSNAVVAYLPLGVKATLTPKELLDKVTSTFFPGFLKIVHEFHKQVPKSKLPTTMTFDTAIDVFAAAQKMATISIDVKKFMEWRGLNSLTAAYEQLKTIVEIMNGLSFDFDDKVKDKTYDYTTKKGTVTQHVVRRKRHINARLLQLTGDDLLEEVGDQAATNGDAAASVPVKTRRKNVIRDGRVVLTFSIPMAVYISQSFLRECCDELVKLDVKNYPHAVPVGYTLMSLRGQHDGDGVYNRDIVKTKTLLERAGIKYDGEVRAKGQGYERAIVPLIKSLNHLKERNILKDWYFIYVRQDGTIKEIRKYEDLVTDDDEKPGRIPYLQLLDMNIHYDLTDFPEKDAKKAATDTDDDDLQEDSEG